MVDNQTHSSFNGYPYYLQKEGKEPFKTKMLEWSQKISHCKSMQIFYDLHGQLTPQSDFSST